MILSSFSESEILNSLLADQEGLKRFVKKKVKAYQLENQRMGRRTNDDMLLYDYVSPSKNNWTISIRFQKIGTALWHANKFCAVESEHGNKDYYFLRGASEDSPYFFKLSSHVVKRYLERCLIEPWEQTGFDKEYFTTSIFPTHETCISIKDIPMDYLRVYRAVEDTVNDMEITRLVLNNFGMFFGTKSSDGNFSFKTYVSYSNIIDRLKEDLSSKKVPEQSLKVIVLMAAYHHYNPGKLPKEDAEILRDLLGDLMDNEFYIHENGIILLKP